MERCESLSNAGLSLLSSGIFRSIICGSGFQILEQMRRRVPSDDTLLQWPIFTRSSVRSSQIASVVCGLAIAAFSAAGAIAHGLAEKERFDVRPWLMPRKPGGGGQGGRVYFPALDRYFKIDEARTLLEARCPSLTGL